MIFNIREKLKKIIEINNKRKYKYESIKICIIYLLIGFLWIYYSDRITSALISNKGLLLLINTYKGWFYVIITSIILYGLMSRLLRKVAFAEKEQNQSEEKNSAIIRAIPDLLFVINKEGYFVDCIVSDNKHLLTPKKDFIGRKIDDIMPMEIGEIANEKLKKVFEHGGIECFDYKLDILNIEQYFELRMVKSNENEVLAISRNVTSVRQSENNFKNIFEGSSDAILIICENKIMDCNLAATYLLGYPSKDCIVGKEPINLSPEMQPNGELSSKMAMQMYYIAKNEGKCKFEWWHQRADGSLVPVEIMMTTIKIDGKEVFHSLCRDISERKKMEENLTYLSTHDQLTGLYNRRFFEEKILLMDVESSLPLTITMADINGLKLINDSFGHAVGDELLMKVAEVLKKGCREKDIVSRLAGDEFVIISPNTDSFEAKQLVNGIREIVAGETVRLINLSISFGYETKTNRKEQVFEILKKAEDYMYRRKLYESPSMRGKMIQAIITTLHEKNSREEQHSQRVSELCQSMGKALHLSDDMIEELHTVGLLHDIGKIAVKESILNKSGKLTKDEWEEVKKHPEIGYRILSTVNELSEMAEYVLAHHERWDGNGYPKGLKGEEIPIQSRIIGIADSYDAMISKRSYRNALTKEAAIQELVSNAGTQFNADYVKLFIEKVLNES